MINAILASTSTVHGSRYLEYIEDELRNLFHGVDAIIFIPYARPKGMSYEVYTEVAGEAFARIGISVKGIHEFDDPVRAVNEAQGIFVGGGNTFMLLSTLYEKELIQPLKKVIQNGTAYLGTSAGTNICGRTIKTTNDMPVIYPPSFEAIGLIDFNINPHYIAPDPTSTHMGETRDERILEYLSFNDIPVIALKEGSYLRLKNGEVTLEGPLPAKLFKSKDELIEIKSGTKFEI